MRNIKPRRNTVESMVKSAQAHQKEYPVPDGMPKLTGIDKKRWKAYCLARDSWTDTELTMLYEAVVCHRSLNEAREACRGASIMIEKSTGDMIPNPIFHETRQREKMLQTWLRQIGLHTTPERANSTNGAGKSASGIEKEKVSDNIRSLVG